MTVNEPIDLLAMEAQVEFIASSKETRKRAIESGAVPLLRGYLHTIAEQMQANPERADYYRSTYALISDVLHNKLLAAAA